MEITIQFQVNGLAHRVMPQHLIERCRLLIVFPEQIIGVDLQGCCQTPQDVGLRVLNESLLQAPYGGLRYPGDVSQVILCPAPLLPEGSNPVPERHYKSPSS